MQSLEILLVMRFRKQILQFFIYSNFIQGNTGKIEFGQPQSQDLLTKILSKIIWICSELYSNFHAF
jgi:hypothetical protein